MADLGNIHQVATEAGLPLVVVVMPYRFQLGKADQLNQPQARLNSWAQAQDVRMIDLLPAFARFQADNPATPLFFDPSHLTIEGHQLTARLLAEKLPPHFPKTP